MPGALSSLSSSSPRSPYHPTADAFTRTPSPAASFGGSACEKSRGLQPAVDDLVLAPLTPAAVPYGGAGQVHEDLAPFERFGVEHTTLGVPVDLVSRILTARCSPTDRCSPPAGRRTSRGDLVTVSSQVGCERPSDESARTADDEPQDLSLGLGVLERRWFGVACRSVTWSPDRCRGQRSAET